MKNCEKLRQSKKMGQEDLFEGSLTRIAGVLKRGQRFLMMTHKDPDIDGLGSMLALGKSLADMGKETVMLIQKAIHPPLTLLTGAEKMSVISKSGGFPVSHGKFDAVLALDCAERGRLGVYEDLWQDRGLTINIDHHETNSFFGEINLVDANSSSTGELVYRLIKIGGFPLDYEIAENLFSAIQSDTGSFRFSNTTSAAMIISADLMEYGVKPWEISQKIMSGYGPVRLKLLAMALSNVEFYGEGKIGMMVLSTDMFQRSGARRSDSEGFVDFPRYVNGVELAVMIMEKDEDLYKFSLRSNRWVNVAELASQFGGGGHVRAAGFTCNGNLETLKRDFLFEAGRLLNDAPR